MNPLADTSPLFVNPPGQDPFTVLTQTLDGQVHPGGWDQPTALFWLLLNQPGMIGVRRFPPLPPEFLDIHPVALLDGMALAAQDVGAPALPDGVSVIGLAVVFEMWTATVATGDTDAVAQLVTDGRNHNIHSRPDRVDVRNTVVAMRGGQVRLGMRVRGREVQVADVSSLASWPDDDMVGGATEVFRVCQALRNYLLTITK